MGGKKFFHSQGAIHGAYGRPMNKNARWVSHSSWPKWAINAYLEGYYGY